MIWKSYAFFFAFISFLIASWAIRCPKDNTETSNDIVIVLDVSQSMLVEDMSPKESRLDYAKKQLKGLIARLPEARWGLTIFAGETQSILPLSTDKSLLITFLESVDYNNLTKQGTQLEEAIRQSSKRFDLTVDSKKTIILLSDGGEESVSVDQQLQEFISSGNIQVYIIGIGTPAGGPIPVGVDHFGNTVFKQRENKTITSTLHEKSLRDIASATNGKYLLGTPSAFQGLHKSLSVGGTGGTYSDIIQKGFVGLGFLLLVFGISTQRITVSKRKERFYAYRK